MCEFKYLSLNISLENLLEPVNVSYVCVDKTRNVYPCIYLYFFLASVVRDVLCST